VRKIIYCIRHAEGLKVDGIVNTAEEEQILNEKIVLSVKGEKEANKLSLNSNLKDIDELWSSNYTRAICTAKYIADKTGLAINVDYRLGERKLGDIKKLKEFGIDKKYSYTTMQLRDETLSNIEGESRKDVVERVKSFIYEILNKENTSKIALVTHGALIRFLIMNFGEFNYDTNELIYNGKVIVKDKLNYLDIIKFEFEGNEVVNIEKV
jgi:broad specificity phosphatase PhoE